MFLMLKSSYASQILLVVNVLLSVFSGSDGQGLSTCRINPFHHPTSGKALGITFYIDLNNPFACYGIITKWRFCYKSSPGAISDTIKIGVYEPNSDGDTFTKKGSNSIFLQLQNSDCLNITADPQLVVQSGYVLAFYATLTYIKFFDDTENGYLYKSVSFPNSISKGVLIKTSQPYVAKLQAYIETIAPPVQPSTIISTSTDSYSTESVVLSRITSMLETSYLFSSSIPPTSTPIPVPNNDSGIPPPDLASNECFVGVNEAYATSFQKYASLFLNPLLPSQCNGIVERWEYCYRYVERPTRLHIGVWRLSPDGNTYISQGHNEIIVAPKELHHSDPLACDVSPVDIPYQIREGDIIGFNSSDMFMAFSYENIITMKRTTDTPDNHIMIPLIRAIIVEQSLSTMTISSYTYTPISSMIFPTTTPVTPTFRRRSVGVIVGSILSIIVFCLLTIIVLSMCTIIWRRNQRCGRVRLHSRDDMIYNAQYVPSDCTEVIIHNRKESINIKENQSYSKYVPPDLRELPSSPSSPIIDPRALDHTYESI